MTIEQVRALWPAVLDEIKSNSRVIWMLLVAAHPLSVEGDVPVASHENVGTVKRFSQSSAHDDNVANATAAVIGKPLRIQLVVGDSAGAPVPSGGIPDVGGKSRGATNPSTSPLSKSKPTTSPKVSTSTTLLASSSWNVNSAA